MSILAQICPFSQIVHYLYDINCFDMVLATLSEAAKLSLAFYFVSYLV